MLYGERYLCSWQKLQECGYNLVIMEVAKKLLVDPFAEDEAFYRRFFAEVIA